MIKTLAFILIQITSINQKLLKTIEAFQQQDGITGSIVSVHVVDCEDEKELISFNSEKSVNSASILKLASTGAILKTLGPDFRFKTDLAYSGTLKDGVILGDLFVISDGDPSLGSNRYPETAAFIPEIINCLKSLGIRKITGDLKIIDPDYFGFDTPDTWIWGDMGNYYGAIPYQFNFNENLFSVYFDAPYKLNDEVSIGSIYPNSKSWEINNVVKAGQRGSGDQVYIYSAPNSHNILMKGTVPIGAKNFEVKGSIPHPAAVFKGLMIEQLKLNQIEIEKPNELINSFFPNTSSDLNTLKSFYSPPLSTLIKDCNYRSINLFADAFAQKLYSLKTGTYSLSKGAKALIDFWEEEGAATEGFEPKDGSGLSPSGLVTGEAMTSILKHMYASPYFPEYLASIPVLGESGTVKYMDRSNITSGRVSAKSGSISGTRSYAGYAKAKNGHTLAFSMIVNRYENGESMEVKDFLENLMINLIDLE